MHYVIIRDDDTNPLTPPAYLERLYRPFLDRGMPVNLATIPHVRTDVKLTSGEPEGFLLGATAPVALPIASNAQLIDYLRANDGFRIVQHGYHHDMFEFERHPREEIARRLDHGTELLREAGFAAPKAFVAPYDRISRAGYRELAARFSVLSTGWFELGRLPVSWWPGYAVKKAASHRHWRVNGTRLLSHPGCLLSCHRPHEPMLDAIRQTVFGQRVTVLVTHWWEYFRAGVADEAFIGKLHETAEFLASSREIKVVSFDALVDEGIALN
jgi:Uncharacterized protein conserved in bacteria (DUF2334)